MHGAITDFISPSTSVNLKTYKINANDIYIYICTQKKNLILSDSYY